jgi:hypothetical protein
MFSIFKNPLQKRQQKEEDIAYDFAQQAECSIIVLGMHRSGTSCLMGMFESAGVYLGTTNPRVKEPGTLVSINNTILEYSGGTWDRPPERIKWAVEHEKRTKKFLEATYGQKKKWGMKDPRLVLTFDFWYPRWLPSSTLVGTFRNPISVARSLNRRNPARWSLEAGVELWTAYNRKLIELHDRYKFPLIDFDQPDEIYQKQVSKTMKSIGLGYNQENDFFEPDSRHWTSVELVNLDPHVVSIYDALKSRAMVS